MTLGRLEMHQPRRSEFVLVRSRAHEQSALEHHHQGMLMDLMIVQPLALREGQQDHPVGVVVGIALSGMGGAGAERDTGNGCLAGTSFVMAGTLRR